MSGFQLKNKFIITTETCTVGFQNHVKLRPMLETKSQLGQRYLYVRKMGDAGNHNELIKIIEKNSSLRISFGWSFESSHNVEEIMAECLEELESGFGSISVNIVSDLRGDWIGFLPYNIFECEIYRNLDVYGLIIFNNELCNFQERVVDFIRNHRIYKSHLILRDTNYRYDYFRKIRRDSVALSDAFHNVMESFNETLGLPYYPRQIIEEMVGCHFLYHPDTFFELLEFYTLKGLIYE